MLALVVAGRLMLLMMSVNLRCADFIKRTNAEQTAVAYGKGDNSLPRADLQMSLDALRKCTFA